MYYDQVFSYKFDNFCVLVSFFTKLLMSLVPIALTFLTNLSDTVFLAT